KPPHHHVGHREARHRSREGHHQHRAVRQHDCRDDPARAERRRVLRQIEEGRSRAARVGRRWLHGWRGAAALGLLTARDETVERHAPAAVPATSGDWAFVIGVITAVVVIALVPLFVLYWLVNAAAPHLPSFPR